MFDPLVYLLNSTEHMVWERGGDTFYRTLYRVFQEKLLIETNAQNLKQMLLTHIQVSSNIDGKFVLFYY